MIKDKMKNRILSLFLAMVMVFGMIPGSSMTAYAAGSVSYQDAAGSDHTISSYTEVATGTTTFSSGWYVVSANTTISSRITVNGAVHLILCDGATLNADAGISVNSGNSLTIYGQAGGTGTLVSGTPDSRAASIGGDYYKDAGDITINGGIVEAKNSNTYVPAIGGGYAGDGGTVTINGGKVTAYGNCGIGSGMFGSLDKITISGGTVTATGTDSAGIGSYGSNTTNTSAGYVSEILITGGNVSATGKYGAGIGGGRNSYGNWKITISGGIVNATCNTWGSGIGGGYGGNGSYTIKITGGTITASGQGPDAYDIGGGQDSTGTAGSASISVTGGNIQAANGKIGGTSLSYVEVFVGGALEGQSVDAITLSDGTYDTSGMVIPKENKMYLVLKDGVEVTSVTIDGTSFEYISENLFCIHKYLCTQDDTCVLCGVSSNTTHLITHASTEYSYVVNNEDATKHDVFHACCEEYIETVAHEFEDGICVYCHLSDGTTGYPYVYRKWDTTTQSVVSEIRGIMPEYNVTSSLLQWSSGWYIVNEDIEITKEIVVTGSVNLLIVDGYTLTAENGITVNEGNSLTIYGQSADTGTLIVKGASNSAGIGGGYQEGAGGTITIYGGTVTATGSYGGAGIGGSCYGAGGMVTIYGGKVTATGSSNSAGIGGGREGTSGTITIYGGKVTATGDDYGAGIGSGYKRAGETITIYGGTVEATSGKYGAGIGGGHSGAGGTITIKGGTVTATGGYQAAGIGGGHSGAGGTITIKGGTVTATGGYQAAGIGGGYSGAGETITIEGGTVTAAGGQYGAGIGGGCYGDGGNVVITGGNVKTQISSSSADAIGKGSFGNSSGTLTDGNENEVSLRTLTLDGLTTAAEVTEITGCDYGINDVLTLDTNKLYFYLPANSSVNTITAGGEEYFCQKDQTFYTSHDWSNKDGICTHCGEACAHQNVEDYVCDVCGKIFHTHSWDYTVNGATITATCSNTDGNCENTAGGSITLNVADGYYTGSGIGATVTGSLTTGAAYAVTYDNGDTTKPSSVGNHSATVTVSENDSVAATASAEYEISYLPAPDNAYTISNGYRDAAGTYWFKDGDTITVSAPDGYTVSTSLNGTYGTAITLSETDDKVIYLKKANDEMTDAVSITDQISFDKTAPAGKISITDRSFWQELLNKISFNYFFNTDTAAFVTTEDSESGVSSVEYYLTDKDLIDDSTLSDADAISKLETAVNGKWIDYEHEIALIPNAKNVIYVKITDNVGNVTYIDSEGIVLYTDAEADTETVTTVYRAGLDKDVQVVLNDNTIQAVVNGETILSAGTDYTVNDHVITLKADYLDTLSGGDYTFTVSYHPLGLEYMENTANDTPETTTFKLSVERADSSVTNISDISKTYDGTAVSNPTYTSDSTGNAVYEYKVKGTDDGTYTTTAPENAGDYVVRVTVAADTNYKEAAATAEFTIGLAKLTDVSVKQDGTMSYTGNPQTAKVQTSATAKGNQTVTFTYSDKEDGTYTDNVPAFTAKRIYTVYYKASADNHSTESGEFTVTIGMADNEWTTAPSIVGWTYGQNENVWTAEAKFGTVNVTYIGTANDGTAYDSTTAPTNAGNYKAIFTVEATGDYGALTTEVSFTIAKADQTAPDVSHTDETIDGKTDGTITGLTTAMEYRKNDETDYNALNSTELTDLADGTYNIRYKADDNHNPSPDTVVEILAGEKLMVSVPKVQTGYTLTVDKEELAWNDNVTLTFTLAEGYSKLDGFAVNVTVNESTIKIDDTALDENGKYTVTDVKTDVLVEVAGVADTTAPTAEITFGENKWNQFFNNITFGLFFKDTQTVTITAEDQGSGIDKIYYYLSAVEMSLEDIERSDSENWTEYTEAFDIDPQEEYIIYAVAFDQAGNAVCVSSDKKIIVDSIAPTITGVADGETHYGDTTFGVEDAHIDAVTVDGQTVELTDGSYTITADDQEHTIAAADRSGNVSTEIRITVITIASLDDDIEDITTDNVTSSDKKAIEDVQSLVNSLLNSEKAFTQTEQSQLEGMKTNVEALLKQISDVAAEMADITTKVNAYDKSKVKSDDKDALHELYTRINTLLNGENLTEEEITAIKDLQSTVRELIDRIARIANKVTDLTSEVNAYDKDAVKSTDHDTIDALVTDMTDLLNGENLNETEKEAVGATKATAEALLEKISEVGKEKSEVTESIKAYDIDKVKSDDKETIEGLIGQIDGLTGGENLTEEEKTELAAVKETAEGLLERIEETGEKAEDLKDQMEALEEDRITLEDEQEIKDLLEEVEKLLESNLLTEAEKEELQEVKATAEGLLEQINSFYPSGVERLAGDDRYKTAYKTADALKKALNVEKFACAIITTGKEYADALSGSYLAAIKQAPILLTNGKEENVTELITYIKANVAEGSTVYILGGENAVTAKLDVIEGYNVKRLAGKDRYETNLKILEEAGMEDAKELIVVTGKEFADGLSASATGRPILLVKKNGTLSEEQKAIAEQFKGGKIYILGGESAVNAEVEAELKTIAENESSVERIAGENRYETSVKVAETFFEAPKAAVTAYGKNFPDGLCGGSLAAALNIPLLLTRDGYTKDGAAYIKAQSVTNGYVLGGTGVLSDETVREVYALEDTME